MVYDDNMVVKDALQIYFTKYGFDNGGYDLKWFRIRFGNVSIPLPNIKARVDAVKIHDLHHLVTEYPATVKGEAEIGGWEIASGCGKYYASWILNTGAFFLGLLLHQRALLKAFLKGRTCSKSLYYEPYNEALLNKTVGELREIVGNTNDRKNTIGDYLLFVSYTVFTMLLCFLFFYGIFKAALFIAH